MKKLIACFTFLCVIISCSDNTNILPRYTGSAGEIVTIVDTHIWDGEFGNTVKQYFEQATPHLPQPEALYYLGQYPHSGFSKLLKQHRNIFIINIDNKLPKNEVNLLRSKWAKAQVVVQLNAVSVEDAITLFGEYKESILNLFETAEIERLQHSYYNKASAEVKTFLADSFGIKLNIPADMGFAVGAGDQALWLKRERVKYLSGVGHDISQGLVIYQFPYDNDSTFTIDFLINARNNAVKVVTADGKDKYMITELEIYPPEGEITKVNGNVAFFATGLWKMQNSFMGGPFANILVLDEKNQRVIGIDGYVFAPKFNKREYIREMKAMLKSIEFID